MKPSSNITSNLKLSDDWEFKFETKDNVYFKSTITTYLDDQYGDLKNQIKTKELEIML